MAAAASQITTTNTANIHIFFLPLLARGHILPCVHAAHLFSERGARCTIVTTHGNSTFTRRAIEQGNGTASLHPVDLLLIPFPSADVGLPSGAECTDVLPQGDDNFRKLFAGVALLRRRFQDLVIQHRPDCIVSDCMIFWPAHMALEFSIPHLGFSVLSPFARCVMKNLFITGAHLNQTESDTVGPLVGLPHPMVLTRSELPTALWWPNVFENTLEAERRSLGIMFNCFDELTPEYVEHFSELMMPNLVASKTNVWCIGPVQLHDNNGSGNSAGKWDGIIKKWLDSKEPESVLYICFGSEVLFPAQQLREIALGLEGCQRPFVWVVRGEEGKDVEKEFGPRVGNRGLILTEWAPQVAILNHQAIGGFVTHCGWSSIMEAVCAGLPMLAWPVQWEQFINERLVVEVLRIGVRILEGPKKELVKEDAVRVAIDRLMGSGDEEVSAIRSNAEKYGQSARLAMKRGGSSYVNLSIAVDEIATLLTQKKDNTK